MRKARILIVDATPSGDALEELLSCSGYVVQSVPTEQAAVRASRAFEPDLVLFDCDISFGNEELAPGLRHEVPGLPVIGMTARDFRRLEHRCRGGSVYVTKPVDVDALIAVVEELVGGRTESREGGESGQSGAAWPDPLRISA